MLEKARSTLRQKLDQQTEALKSRRDSLKHRGEELQHKGEELKHKVEARVEEGRGRVLQAEAQVLEAAADALAKARETLGERAAFVEKGEKALREALVDLRAGHAATLPIPGYDALNVKHAIAALEGLDLADLRTVHAYESKHKARVTVLREADKRIASAEAS